MIHSSGPAQYQYGNGLICSILASILFGATPWLAQQLQVDGNQLFSIRMVFGSLCLIIAITCSRQWQAVKELLQIRRNLIFLVPGTLLIGLQWWLFVWAPVNQQTKELALGYFLLPLTLALTGKLVFGEQLNTTQKLAITFAFAGVITELWQQQQLSWVTLVVAGLYPVYFILRRQINADVVSVMLCEQCLFLPFTLFFLLNDRSFVTLIITPSSLWFLLPAFGLISVLSMLMYMNASKKLPFSLFGLLSYLEPVILFLVAIVILHETVETPQWLTYGLIWIATLIVAFDLIRKLIAPHKPLPETP